MAYVYIKIPCGYRFQAGSKGQGLADCFVNDDGCQLPLQSVVKAALQHKSKHSDYLTQQGITLYYQHAPKSDDLFLRYLPANNGKSPSTELPTQVVGTRYCKHAHRVATSCSQSWFSASKSFFSFKRQAEIAASRRAQRDNLRKVGDSPAAN